MRAPDWQAPLLRAMAQGAPPDRFATFATVDAQGWPQARTVVVRTFTGGARPRLCFTVDLRSAKVAELVAEPRAAVCWYLAGERLQFRLGVRAAISANKTERSARWAALSPTMRAGFAAGRPGEGLDTFPAEPADLLDESTESMPEHFGVVSLDVCSVDLVDLTAPTLRRFVYRPEGEAWIGHEVWP